MYVTAVDVLVQIDDVGLVAVAHLLHVFVCQFRELPVREAVVHRGVQGDMQYRLFRVPVCGKVTVKSPYCLLHDIVGISGEVGNHAVARDDTCGCLVHFTLVVDDSPVERYTPVDLSHHSADPPSFFL